MTVSIASTKEVIKLETEVLRISFLWAIPVCAKLLGLDSAIIFQLGLIPSTYSLLRVAVKPEVVLFTLPFFALLSPMVGFINAFGQRLLLSDIFFLFMLSHILLIFMKRSDPINQTKFNYSFLILFALLVLSSFFGYSSGIITSLKPLLYLIQLCFIYFYTQRFALKFKIINSILTAWLSAIFLGSLILIYAYANGEILKEFALNENGEAISNKSILDYFFQATYYYTGFIFLVGIGIVILFIRFFINNNIFVRISLLLISLVLIMALFLMNNKTVIFSLLLVLGVIVYSLSRLGIIKKSTIILVLSIITGVLIFVIVPLFIHYVDSKQFELMIQRFKGVASFNARLQIFSVALKSWFSFPAQVIFGMGPDFLDGSGQAAISGAFKKSKETGIVEGTVDSGWLSYLLEMGLLGFGCLLVIYVRVIRSSYQKLKMMLLKTEVGLISLYIFFSLSFLTLALSTQMLGYSKTSWLPFQLLVFGVSVLKQTERRYSTTNKLKMEFQK